MSQYRRKCIALTPSSGLPNKFLLKEFKDQVPRAAESFQILLNIQNPFMETLPAYFQIIP